MTRTERKEVFLILIFNVKCQHEDIYVFIIVVDTFVTETGFGLKKEDYFFNFVKHSGIFISPGIYGTDDLDYPFGQDRCPYLWFRTRRKQEFE